MNQISENLFNAIDIIIQERLKDLRFDRTIVGTIVDDSKRDKGIYQIKYQKLLFLAYANDTSLTNDTQVYVLIPENEDGNKRFIIGKYIAGGEVINE